MIRMLMRVLFDRQRLLKQFVLAQEALSSKAARVS